MQQRLKIGGSLVDVAVMAQLKSFQQLRQSRYDLLMQPFCCFPDLEIVFGPFVMPKSKLNDVVWERKLFGVAWLSYLVNASDDNGTSFRNTSSGLKQ